MQSLIDEAVKNAELEKTDTKANEADDFIGAPRIMVIGCGGAGNNTINRLYHMGIKSRISRNNLSHANETRIGVSTTTMLRFSSTKPEFSIPKISWVSNLTPRFMHWMPPRSIFA
jgi:hypothetical protein